MYNIYSDTIYRYNISVVDISTLFENIDINKDIPKNIDIDKEFLENINITFCGNIDKINKISIRFFENIAIDKNSNKEILKISILIWSYLMNIDIDMAILD